MEEHDRTYFYAGNKILYFLGKTQDWLKESVLLHQHYIFIIFFTKLEGKNKKVNKMGSYIERTFGYRSIFFNSAIKFSFLSLILHLLF